MLVAFSKSRAVPGLTWSLTWTLILLTGDSLADLPGPQFPHLENGMILRVLQVVMWTR